MFPALAIVAALSDATTMTIPNWISVALALAFFPAAFAVGMPASAIGLSVALPAWAPVAGMAMFALHWIGGGDAKLFAASALWLGMAGAAPFLVWTAIAGGALALALLGARRWASDIGVPSASRAGWSACSPRKGDIPYGIAIAAGALAAFPLAGTGPRLPRRLTGRSAAA